MPRTTSPADGEGKHADDGLASTRPDAIPSSMTDPDHSLPVLLNTFTIAKKKCKLYFHKGVLVWEPEKSPHSQQTLPMEDVLSVHLAAQGRPDCTTFVVHFAKRRAGHVWRYGRVKVKHSDPLQVSSWVVTLNNYLKSFTNRPKRLLLFVNPYGGRKKALEVFDRYSKPLFSLANVEVHVVLTQRPNQILDIVLSLELDSYDSIACVGGDGTFSELFNGLVLRTCRDRGVDPDDVDVELVRPKWRVGVIPGGSTDTIAYCLHGTDDVQTAVLHIIFGDTVGMDLVSVHGDRGLLRLYGSIVSYGFLGDLAAASELYRWMGPRRYAYCGFRKFMGNRAYEGEVTMCSARQLADRHKCAARRCEGCAPPEQDKAAPEWKTVRGKFFMISGANISCANSRSPQGLAPFSHIGNGEADLILVRHTNIFNVFRLLLRLSSKSKTIEELPFVEIHRVKEFYFRAASQAASASEPSTVPGVSLWNCDGEVIRSSDIRAKVRSQLISVFSRRQNEEEQPAGLCCSS